MTRNFPLLCMVAALSGCTSLTYPLPKCDGYSRRPLNRSMWQWEDNSNLNQKHSDTRSTTSQHAVTPYADEHRDPPAFAHLDIDASYRPCEG
jgi:type IV secretion system protein VirB7